LGRPDKGNAAGHPKPESAVSEADLRAYYDRKRPLGVWSIGIGLFIGLGIALIAPLVGAAFLAGTACGVANALLSMRGNERLLEHRSAAAFVFSSILRIAVFGIVPVVFAVHGSGWSMPAYFAGFFTPLGLYAVFVRRAVRMR